ncbi:hypothetical protein MBMB1_1874 [Methanobacterium sp. MB1]|nr:hypothetical protein MBMB1_1874 [Methanobacterium sp. MB1]
MVKKIVFSIGMMAILLLSVMVSGCTSSSDESSKSKTLTMTAEQIKANATPVGGEELQRNAMNLLDTPIKITGTIQAMDTAALVIIMDDNPNYIVKIETIGHVPLNLIKGDTVTIYGVCEGKGVSEKVTNPIPIVEAWADNIIRV